MPDKAFRLYHAYMPDDATRTIIQGPAVPLSITVMRDGGHWCIRAWYHGTTMHDALNPQLVAERYLSKADVPLTCPWHVLWRAVALAVEDLATLSGGITRVD